MANNTPAVRFEGFSGEWEKCKLAEVSRRVRGNDTRMDLPTLTISAKSGWLDQRERFSGNIAGKEQKNYTLLKKGQLAYNHGNSKLAKYGVVFELTNYDEALVPRVYHSFEVNNLATSKFIQYMFSTKRPDKELGKLVSSGARLDGLLNINYDEFMGIEIKRPSIEEQSKIGSFFKQLDDTIALQQQELETLKQTKQGFLQKMFPKEGETVPEVRFEGFSGEWEERKLATEFKKVNERNNGTLGKEHWISVAKMYFQSPDKVQSNNIDTRTYVMKLGDIAFEGHPNKQFKFGRFVVNDIGTGVVSELFPIYRHIKDYSNNYWKAAIQIEKIMSPIFSKSIASSGNSSNKLDPQHFLRQLICIPKLEEQSKIGDFFKQLDDTIALQQQELDTLKQTKQGFLQKMFPKEGETIPKVRFEGFSGEFKKSKLEDYFTERSERSSSGELISVTINSGVIRAADLNRRDSSSENKSNYKVVKTGDIAYNSMRMWQGASGYSPYDGILSPAYTVIKPKEEVYPQFFAYLFKRSDMIQTFQKNSQGLTSDTWNLKFPTLKRIIVNVPKYEEQRKIACFFKQLDDTISLNQRELEALKETKQAFLQKMFV